MSTLDAELLALVGALAPITAAPRLEDTFAELGYTSLRFLELTIAVERAFDLQPLSPECLAGVETVGDLAGVVRARREMS